MNDGHAYVSVLLFSCSLLPPLLSYQLALTVRCLPTNLASNLHNRCTSIFLPLDFCLWTFIFICPTCVVCLLHQTSLHQPNLKPRCRATYVYYHKLPLVTNPVFGPSLSMLNLGLSTTALLFGTHTSVTRLTSYNLFRLES